MSDTTGVNPTDGAALMTAGMLQAALLARKVNSIVALSWSGPQLNAYTVELQLGERPETVEQLAGALAMAARAESCRVARQGGQLLLEIPKPKEDRKALIAGRLEGLTPATSTAVAAGITTGGRPVWIDIADERFAHVVLGGTTGSGKTVLLRWLLYRLAQQNPPADLRMILLDPKRFELKEFARLPHLLHPITAAPLEVARVLTWVGAELERRAASGRTRPRLVVAVEEVAELGMLSAQIGPLLARVAQIGRALGVHLLVSTQQPGAKALGDALVNFPARCVGRIASSTLAYGAAGRKQTGADALLGRGDFLLVAAGETVRFQAPLPDGRQWGALPRAAAVASLEADLPVPALLADRNRDPRGGPGAKVLGSADYAEIQAAINDGATVDQLRRLFGIGYERAARIYQSVTGVTHE